MQEAALRNITYEHGAYGARACESAAVRGYSVYTHNREAARLPGAGQWKSPSVYNTNLGTKKPCFAPSYQP